MLTSLTKHNYRCFARKKTKTYNSRDSLVVTHPTTNRPACGLSTAERTGSPVFHTLWSYVLAMIYKGEYIDTGIEAHLVGYHRWHSQGLWWSESGPSIPDEKLTEAMAIWTFVGLRQIN